MDREDVSLPSRYPAAPRRMLTVEEYHRMGEVGILTEDDRVELIEGELVAVAPIRSEHVAATNALNRLWIVNLTAEEVEVYRSPVAGSYSAVTRATRSDTLTIEAVSGSRIAVAKIFAS